MIPSLWWKRWPRVLGPLFNPNNSRGSVCSPKSNSNHCTGRKNSSRDRPHRIRLETGMAATALAMMLGITSAACAPCCDTWAAIRSAPCSSTISRSSVDTPCLRAKPSAALVHSPASFFAAESGGPTTCCSVSGAFMATLSTRTAKRRGVEKCVAAVRGSPCSARPSVTPLQSAAAMPEISPAGSSSVPSSKRRSAVLISRCPRRLPIAPARLRLNLGQLGGSPARLSPPHRPRRQLSPTCEHAECIAGVQ